MTARPVILIGSTGGTILSRFEPAGDLPSPGAGILLMAALADCGTTGEMRDVFASIAP